MTSVLFLPLHKADAAKRIVSGVAVSEIADRSGEIFDYASSKPEFKKWSAEIEKASGGKSLGNVRAMHGTNASAAGKLTAIGFNDREKSIEVSAKIVDGETWRKIEDGVYTGFSIGGRYLRRWDDGNLKRYTAQPSELSLVDMPCVPTALFEIIKANGMREQRSFANIRESKMPTDQTLQRRAVYARWSRFASDIDPLIKTGIVNPERAPHSIGSADPDRKRELGEVEIDLGAEQRRIRVAYDPQGGTLNLHGVVVQTSDLDRDLMRSFEATAAMLNEMQGREEEATARTLLAALIDRVLRRHKFAADALVRQLDHERFTAV
jgi:hypothetical protein